MSGSYVSCSTVQKTLLFKLINVKPQNPKPKHKTPTPNPKTLETLIAEVAELQFLLNWTSEAFSAESMDRSLATA